MSSLFTPLASLTTLLALGVGITHAAPAGDQPFGPKLSKDKGIIALTGVIKPTIPAGDPREPVLPHAGMQFGAWTDAVEVPLPPSPSGTAPQVQLVASHGVADGVMGTGYELVAGSTITRRSSEGGVPGTTAESTYYLDGVELIRIPTLLPFFPFDTQVEIYQPETFDGTQLELNLATNTWRMGRDGWTWTFGSTPESPQATKTLWAPFGRSAQKLIQGIPVVHIFFDDAAGTCLIGDALCNTAAWFLAEVEDPYGNRVVYDYEIDTLPSDLFDGYWYGSARKHLLSSIDYPGGRVDFSYAPRPEPSLSFASGTPTFLVSRLTDIDVFSGSDAHYASYHVEYKDEAGLDCDGNPTAADGYAQDDLIDRPSQSLVRRILRLGTGPNRRGYADARVVRCVETHYEGYAWSQPEDLSDVITQPVGSTVPGSTFTPITVQLNGDGVDDLIVLGVRYGFSGVSVNHSTYRGAPMSADGFSSQGPILAEWENELETRLDSALFDDGRGFAFADVNHDGWSDLLVEDLDEGTRDVIIRRWDPHTERFATEDIAVKPCDLRFSSLNDIDADGFPDLVLRKHDGSPDCASEDDARWLRNLGKAPWFDKGPSNQSWRPLETPEAAIIEEIGGSVVVPDMDRNWSDEQYVAQQSRFIDANADGIVDLAYSLHLDWDYVSLTSEECEDQDICGDIPAGGVYSRIFFGDGYGGFVDSGLSAGGPVLSWRSYFGDNRLINSLLAGLDVSRSGRPELLTPMWGGEPDGAVFRGLRHGFGANPVTGAAADPSDIDLRFYPPTFQVPATGDSCHEQTSLPAFGDFDGDGFVDILSLNLNNTPHPDCAGAWCVKLYRSTRQASQGRITASDGAWGGRTELEWGFSADRTAGVDMGQDTLPMNVEVLTAVEGSEGRVEMRYRRGTQSKRRFRGFGVVERKRHRGGVDRFAFGVTPALQGKLLYAARYRPDTTLERLTVNAFGVPSSEVKTCGPRGHGLPFGTPALEGPLTKLEPGSPAKSKDSGSATTKTSDARTQHNEPNNTKTKDTKVKASMNEESLAAAETKEATTKLAASADSSTEIAKTKDDSIKNSPTKASGDQKSKPRPGTERVAKERPAKGAWSKPPQWRGGDPDDEGVCPMIWWEESTWALDTEAPYFNPLVRRCEYEVERSAIGSGTSHDVADFIDHCYEYGADHQRPAHDQILAAFGLYRYPGIGTPARHVSDAVWGDEAGTGRPELDGVVLATEDDPGGPRSELFEPDNAGGWAASTGIVKVLPRWPWPAEVPEPDVISLAALANTRPEAFGSGFSAWLLDKHWDPGSRKLIEERRHRDVTTPDDDLLLTYSWEKPSKPTWAQYAGPWYRQYASSTTDVAANRLMATSTRSDFVADVFDAPQTITVCGVDGDGCRTDVYSYYDDGELHTHTRPDGRTLTRHLEPFCGVERIVDAEGRERVRNFSNRCLATSETSHGLTRSWSYDAFNRVETSTVDSGGTVPSLTLELFQDDDLAIREDSGFDEPRLIRYRPADGLLERSWLDGFGRLTRKSVCQATLATSPPSSIDDFGCAAGTSRVMAWQAWGEDGTLLASAEPWFEDDPAATPAVTRYQRDGFGRQLATRTPAHVDLSLHPPSWLTQRTWHAPHRVVRRDPLQRVAVERHDTLGHTSVLGGNVLASSTLDAFGRVLSSTDASGLTTLRGYYPDHTLETLTRAATELSVDDTGALVTSEHVRVFEYDALGRQTREIAADGSALEVILDGVGRSVSSTFYDAAGNPTPLREWDYEDTPQGTTRVTETDLELGHVATRVYDGLSNLLSEDLGGGVSTTWTYHLNGKVASVTKQDGSLSLQSSYDYNRYGWLEARELTGEGPTTYGYDAAGRVVEAIDAHGVRETFTYVYSGKPLEHLLHNGAGATWTMSENRYDPGGRPLFVMRDGVFGTRIYDAQNRLAAEEVGLPLAYWTIYKFDGLSSRVTEVRRHVAGSQAVHTTYNVYDAWGRQIETTDPDAGTTQFDYDVLGRLRRVVDAEGYARETTYDARGRRDLQDTFGRNVVDFDQTDGVSFVYAHSGASADGVREISASDALGQTTRRWVDALGRELGLERPDGTRVERIFDGTRLSNELALDASGNVIAETRYVYGPDGLLDGQYGPAAPSAFGGFDPTSFPGYAIRWERDAFGRLDAVDAAGERTEFEYGADGLMTTERFRGLERELFRDSEPWELNPYPHVDRDTLTSLSGGPVRERTLSRDSAGRTTSAFVDDGLQTVESRWESFDHYGQPQTELRLVDGLPEVSHSWTYTPAGRPESRTTTVLGSGPYETSWQWYANGVLLSEIGPTGSGFVYDYGPTFDHELDRVEGAGGALLGEVLERSDRGRPTRIWTPKGEVELAYDALGRIDERWRYGASGAMQMRWDPDYDALGRVTYEAWQTASGDWWTDYAHDPAGRLLSETRQRPGADVESVGYVVGPAGQRLASEGTLDGQDQTMETVWDPAYPNERITHVSVGGTDIPISYDAWDGVLADQHGNLFTRDAGGHVRSVDHGEGPTTIYRDANGLPVATLEGEDLRVTAWRLDAAQRPLQIIGPGGDAVGYAAVDGVHIGRLDYASGQLVDQMLSPSASLVRHDGDELATGSAFGVGVNVPADGERFLFGGMEVLGGDSSVHFARHRAYDPQTGRFLNPDPAGLGGGLHRTLYANGDPVDQGDPMGLSACYLTPPEIDTQPLEIPGPHYVEGATGGPATPSMGPGMHYEFADDTDDPSDTGDGGGDTEQTESTGEEETGTAGAGGDSPNNPADDTDATGADASQGEQGGDTESPEPEQGAGALGDPNDVMVPYGLSDNENDFTVYDAQGNAVMTLEAGSYEVLENGNVFVEDLVGQEVRGETSNGVFTPMRPLGDDGEISIPAGLSEEERYNQRQLILAGAGMAPLGGNLADGYATLDSLWMFGRHWKLRYLGDSFLNAASAVPAIGQLTGAGKLARFGSAALDLGAAANRGSDAVKATARTTRAAEGLGGGARAGGAAADGARGADAAGAAGGARAANASADAAGASKASSGAASSKLDSAMPAAAKAGAAGARAGRAAKGAAAAGKATKSNPAGRVGSYNSNGRFNRDFNRGKTYDQKMNADHMPASSQMKGTDDWSHGRGVTMNVPYWLHVLGRTHGNKAKQLGKEAARDSLARDLWHYRKVMREHGVYREYVDSMLDVIHQNKTKFPTAFSKSP